MAPVSDCTCLNLEPGIYRVAYDGSVHKVTQVVVSHAPLGWIEWCLIALCFSIIILIGFFLWRSLRKTLLVYSEPKDWGDYLP